MMPGGLELAAIIAVIVLLFGAKKIPELAKGVGKGIKEFKGALKEDEEPTEPKELAKKDEEKTTEKVEEKKSENA
ncbi:MAG: twin-arginine translocase TatA/TatE family subunit [Sulfurovum sp.]|nr:twin-arginine translocase TatA/TatE family subunit [Sulfurovum sp.]